MADNIWDNSDADNDGNVAANWSLNRVPTGTDNMKFTAAGVGVTDNCLFSGPISCAGIEVVSDYSGDIDFATFDYTGASGSSVILDGTGIFDCGTGSHSVTAGTIDNKDQATFTRSLSTWTLNGVCTMIGHSSNDFNNLTFASGSTVAIDAATSGRIDIQGTCAINGAVVLNDILTVFGDGDFVLNSGASFSGSSILFLRYSNSAHGIITLDGSVEVPSVQVFGAAAGVRLAAGTYSGLARITASAADNSFLELDSGTYNFNGGLELQNDGSGEVKLNNSENNPVINVTDLIVDCNSGTITVDDSSTAVNWIITGDVIDEAATGFTWTKGTGSVTLSGTANQACDFMDQDCGQIIISKAVSGTVDIEAGASELGAVTMVDDLTFTNSTMTASADAKSVTGDVSFADAGNDINLGSGAWSITGDLDLSSVGTWAGGTAVITASGGSAQAWDLDGKTVAAIVVNKTAGTLTWSAASTMTTFTGTSTGTGDFDPNEQTITITGNCSWATAFVFNSGADIMDGCAWVIGGNFTADGQTLNATASWDLQVTGTANASGTGSVEYSDANEGTSTEIRAFNWVDGGNNSNWNFQGISNLQLGGVGLGERDFNLVFRPKQNVEILM